MLKKIPILILITCLVIGKANAQKPDKYAEIITKELLYQHLKVLADDGFEGRETTKKGQFEAGYYIAHELQTLGIDPIIPVTADYNSYFQWFNVFVNGKRQKLNLENTADSANYHQALTMNVMGLIKGTEQPEEYVVLSAHYDHIGISSNGEINNGADDDGSGTAALLSIAKAFSEAKKDGHGPKKSILFLFVAGEEKGLLGSKYFTDYAPAIPLQKIMCDINIDMIGRKDTNHISDEYIYVIGADKISSKLDAISKEVNKNTINYELDYTYNNETDPNRFYYRSDHYNFAKNRIPVIFFFTGVHEDYHKPGDDIDKILFLKYSNITKFIFHLSSTLADLEGSLPRDSNKK